MNKIIAALAIGWILWVVSSFSDGMSTLDYIPRRHSDQENYYGDYQGDRFRSDSDNERQYHSLEDVSRSGRGSRGWDSGQTLEYRGRSSTTGRYVHR